MKGTFLEKFLKISEINTLILIVILGVMFIVMYIMACKKVSFTKRTTIAIIIGIVLGIVIQMMTNFSVNPEKIVFVSETVSWYELFGNGFIDLLKMIVIPLVMVTIINTIINMKKKIQIGQLVKKTIIVALVMVFIAISIGLILGIVFHVGSEINTGMSKAELKEIIPIVNIFRGLLPSNIIKSMLDMNVISVIIFSTFIAIAAKKMYQEHKKTMQVFFDIVTSLYKIITKITFTIIKLTPYAVIPLIASTIALNGMNGIIEVGKFTCILYLAIIIMFIIQLMMLMVFKINPILYLKKSINVFIFAFTSRSSVGTLPLVIENLTKNLSVDDEVASFVASFGTTAGMQGCAGVFPALLIIFVSNMNAIPIDFSLLAMSFIVIMAGSLGVAGVPGSCMLISSVTLSGAGMASYFPTIGPIIAIDSILDMGRTFLNVSGSMTNALIINKLLKK